MNKIKKLKEYERKTFEDIKHIDENGVEYWYARELQSVLEYVKWDKFLNVIEKAKNACKNSNRAVGDYFLQVGKIVKTGVSTKEIIDYKLSRYACYLIVQNGDSGKEVIALGQTYFAIQTRKQELTEEEYEELPEDLKRFYKRNQTRGKNLMLYKAAQDAGVKNFDKFTNSGYRGLYGGETDDDIAKRKKLRYREDILDNMGSEELAANLFRITQTESKLKRDEIKGEGNASETHYKVGKAIRDVIKTIGGTMPEELPTPEKSLKELEKEEKKNLIKIEKITNDIK